MDDRALLDGLREVVTRVVGAARVPTDVDARTALGDGGLWLDSLEILQVVLASEAEFGITFKPAEDLVGDGLETLGTLADLIRRRRADLAGPAPAASG